MGQLPPILEEAKVTQPPWPPSLLLFPESQISPQTPDFRKSRALNHSNMDESITTPYTKENLHPTPQARRDPRAQHHGHQANPEKLIETVREMRQEARRDAQPPRVMADHGNVSHIDGEVRKHLDPAP